MVDIRGQNYMFALVFSSVWGRLPPVAFLKLLPVCCVKMLILRILQHGTQMSSFCNRGPRVIDMFVAQIKTSGGVSILKVG